MKKDYAGQDQQAAHEVKLMCESENQAAFTY